MRSLPPCGIGLTRQAERKKQFALILPILEQGMIQPKTEAKRAGKNPAC